MASPRPPTLEQIKLLRKTAEDSGNYKIVLDTDNTILESTMCRFIWDDDMEILFALHQNCEMGTLALGLPYKIMAIPYDQIEAIYANKG